MYRIGQEEADAIARVIRSGQLFRIGDPASGHLQECVQFEQEWAAKIGTIQYEVVTRIPTSIPRVYRN